MSENKKTAPTVTVANIDEKTPFAGVADALGIDSADKSNNGKRKHSASSHSYGKYGKSKGDGSIFFNRDNFRIGFTLLAITAVVALLLSLVNYITKDKISAFEEEKAMLSRQEVLVSAAEFKLLDYSDDKINSVYQAFDGEGKFIGFTVETSTNGFGGEIVQTVGINVAKNAENIYQLSVSKISLLSLNDETPGVGTKITSSSFLSQFIGMNLSHLGGASGEEQEPYSAVSGASKEEQGSYSAISGASYSSEGVRSGVEAALALAENIITSSGGAVK